MLAGIILAGENPGSIDQLALQSGERKKSLIPIAGRPMVSYVIEAFRSTERIGPTVVVGLSEEDGLSPAPDLILHPGFGDLLDNALGAVMLINDLFPHIDRAMAASSDIPLLTGDVIDHMLDACLSREHELIYALVERSVIESRYPGAGRSYRRFGEVEVAGGDLYMLTTRTDHINTEKLRRTMAFRKHALRMARVLGWRTLLRFATGRLTLSETEAVASRVLGLNGGVYMSPDPELAMDVDKPHQLHMVRQILEA